MTKERIEKANEVLKYAIDHKISAKEASVKCGYSDTYVKNVKSLVYDGYENGTIDDELFNLFSIEYEKYKSIKGIGVKADIGNLDIPNTDGNERTTISTKGNNAEIEWVGGDNYPADHIKTLDELLTIANVDKTIWKVDSYVINKWDVTSWKNKEPQTLQNFQVKAKLLRIEELAKYKSASEVFFDLIKDYKPPVLNLNTVNEYNTRLNYEPILNKTENNLLEICIFDLHIGKLGWGGETGENYDTKIARERFLNAIETLLNRAAAFNYNTILFPVGNDFFNSDTIYNTTTAGTPQDEDLRWQKTFTVGVRLLVDAINLLKQTGAKINVPVIPGNHDFERSYYLGSFLEAWFKDDPTVKINNGASPRKYFRFGKVLLGFTHGSEEKESSLPLIMATDIESKPSWSETIYHEWHLGHIHRKRNVKFTVLEKNRVLNEDLGVTVRYLSSLTGTEEWHHKKGFVGSIKAADAFIWNDEDGLMAHLNSNLIPETCFKPLIDESLNNK